MPMSAFSETPHSYDCKCGTCFKSREFPVDVIDRSIRDAQAVPQEEHHPYQIPEYYAEAESFSIKEYKSIYDNE